MKVTQYNILCPLQMLHLEDIFVISDGTVTFAIEFYVSVIDTDWLPSKVGHSTNVFIVRPSNVSIWTILCTVCLGIVA